MRPGVVGGALGEGLWNGRLEVLKVQAFQSIQCGVLSHPGKTIDSNSFTEGLLSARLWHRCGGNVKLSKTGPSTPRSTQLEPEVV